MIINVINEHLSKRIENGELSDDEMVQLIELIGSYLNLKTIPRYAKDTGISYNGAKRFRKHVRIFGIKFIIDND